MIKIKFKPIVFILFYLLFFFPSFLYSQSIEMTSSPNPVGSGARAIAMGGAFIAIADDATAASWNPSGLIQLEKPEFSLVGGFNSISEDNSFRFGAEGNGKQSVYDWNFNYLSFTHPLVLFNRNIVLSINYQHLYNFSREWDFPYTISSTTFTTPSNIHIDNIGQLSAIGLAWSIQATPDLSFGFTFNIWDKWPGKNSWQEIHQEYGEGIHIPTSENFTRQYFGKDNYLFRGFNANIGILWDISTSLTFGAVLKTPFKADITHESKFISSMIFPNFPDADYAISDHRTYDEELKMPLSWGIGFSNRLSKELIIAFDIYRTEWNHFVYKDHQGIERSPLSGMTKEKSDISATHQLRLGFEYRINQKKYIIPVRGGIFYDPAPAEGNPDDYYGFSCGLGLNTHQFSFDFAYQFRFGNDVGDSILKPLGFSQDVHEHQVLLSMIFYLK